MTVAALTLYDMLKGIDRELRLLVMDAIERVEVSVRTRWAHELGLRHGSHAHLNSTLFKARSQHWNHPDAVASLIRAVEQSREIFILHLRSTYDELIENNQRRIALLEKMAEEIYRALR